MPIEYTLAERGNPGKPTDPKKLYAVAKSTGETTVRSLSKRISDISTVSSVDVMAVLEAFFQVVPQELADGRIVRFGDFGSFAISLQGEGAATEKEFTSSLVNKSKVVFRPGKLLAQTVQNADLKRVPNAPARAKK